MALRSQSIFGLNTSHKSYSLWVALLFDCDICRAHMLIARTKNCYTKQFCPRHFSLLGRPFGRNLFRSLGCIRWSCNGRNWRVCGFCGQLSCNGFQCAFMRLHKLLQTWNICSSICDAHSTSSPALRMFGRQWKENIEIFSRVWNFTNPRKKSRPIPSQTHVGKRRELIRSNVFDLSCRMPHYGEIMWF